MSVPDAGRCGRGNLSGGAAGSGTSIGSSRAVSVTLSRRSRVLRISGFGSARDGWSEFGKFRRRLKDKNMLIESGLQSRWRGNFGCVSQCFLVLKASFIQEVSRHDMD